METAEQEHKVIITKIYQKIIFRFLKLLSLLVSTIMGIVCSSGCITNYATPAYGVATAGYKVSGTVVSSDHELPIKGLLITIRDTMSSYGYPDSTKSDSLGRYSLELFGPSGTWDLNVKDIDSTENGSFASKDTIISIPDSTDDGTQIRAEKKVDIKLDKME